MCHEAAPRKRPQPSGAGKAKVNALGFQSLRAMLRAIGWLWMPSMFVYQPPAPEVTAKRADVKDVAGGEEADLQKLHLRGFQKLVVEEEGREKADAVGGWLVNHVVLYGFNTG